jgi:hypothetical protein
MSIEAALEKALYERLLAYASLPPVSWPGLVFPAQGNELPDQFIEPRLIRNPAFNATYDSKRYDGRLVVTLKTKIPVFSYNAALVAVGIAQHLNAQQVFIGSGLRVTIQQPATVLGDDIVDGWIMHPIACPVLAMA